MGDKDKLGTVAVGKKGGDIIIKITPPEPPPLPEPKIVGG